MSVGGGGGVPPTDFGGSAGASAGFPGVSISLPCGISLSLPPFSISAVLSFLLNLPGIFFAFKLSCDLSNPINISAGLSGSAGSFGGGRANSAPPDPDLNDSTP
jgi:hypothetical protein